MILKLLFYFIFCASRPGPVFTFFQLINTSPFVAAIAAGLHASYCHEAKGILGGVCAGIRVVTGPALAVRNIVLTGVPLHKRPPKKYFKKKLAYSSKNIVQNQNLLKCIPFFCKICVFVEVTIFETYIGWAFSTCVR